MAQKFSNLSFLVRKFFHQNTPKTNIINMEISSRYYQSIADKSKFPEIILKSSSKKKKKSNSSNVTHGKNFVKSKKLPENLTTLSSEETADDSLKLLIDSFNTPFNSHDSSSEPLSKPSSKNKSAKNKKRSKNLSKLSSEEVAHDRSKQLIDSFNTPFISHDSNSEPLSKPSSKNKIAKNKKRSKNLSKLSSEEVAHDRSKLLIDSFNTPFISHDSSIELFSKPSSMNSLDDKIEVDPSKSRRRIKKNVNQKEILHEESRRLGQINSFNHSLASYISVSAYCGFFERAYETLKYYRNSESRFNMPLNILPYDELLKEIANQGDIEKMKEVLKMLKDASLTPTLRTIAFCLTCLGKKECSPSITEDINSILQLMEEHKITLDEIFESAPFYGESLQSCLKAVERVRPAIREELEVLSPTTDFILKRNCYHNHLVNGLNNSMFANKVESPAEGVITPEKLSEMVQHQFNQERKGYLEIPTICRRTLTEDNKKHKKLVDEWRVHWRKALHRRILVQKEYMSALSNKTQEKSKPISLFPYFNVLDSEDIVELLMLEVNNLCMVSKSYSSSLPALARALGSAFYHRFQIKYKEKTGILATLKEVYENYCHSYLSRSSAEISYNPRVEWNNILGKKIQTTNFQDTCLEWPHTVKAALGTMLYDIIFSEVIVWKHGQTEKDGVPAFNKIHRSHKYIVYDEIKPSPLLTEMLQYSYENSLTFTPLMMPMLSPPVPWTSENNGGYIFSKSDFIRVKDYALQQKERMKSGGVQKLYPVMDSLNALGSIPWKFNSEILDIITKVFNEGGWKKLGIPPPPSSLPEPPKILKSMKMEERVEVAKHIRELRKSKGELHSLWCEAHYKLCLANYFRDCVFWLPYNMDFRGRTYPIPPHLTHISSDVFRSTMCFALGKKLGKEGLYWLKLHIVNLTGMVKRMSIEDRLKFCEEVMDDIFDSAKYPLDGNKWWTKCDEPWQTLAACKELVAALESESPEEYVSHLPIHQDGSCNGLQHYAALGRDKEGAQSVNLCCFDTPQDVYSCVVDLVEKRRKVDAQNGFKIAQSLEGFVKRKIIKQTVMTTVYGVTVFGARHQILKQLKELDEFPESERNQAAAYLATQTFSSLSSLFSSTKKIQDWLLNLAEGVSKYCLQNVEWETPLGFPIVQPYSKSIIKPPQQSGVVNFYGADQYSKPNARKQKNGFAPNFIHSLDASHMMLTSLFCQKAGISFVSIHDCFWTHASSVPLMNKICREEFAKLHSEPILEDLTNFMINKYSTYPEYRTDFTVLGDKKRVASLEYFLNNVPRKGDYDINEVLNSVFFFS